MYRISLNELTVIAGMHGQCRTFEVLTIQKPPIHIDAGPDTAILFHGYSVSLHLQDEPSWLHCIVSLHSSRLFTVKQIWIQLLL